MDRTMTRSNPTLTSTRPNSTSDHCPSSRLEPFFGDNEPMLQARTDLTSRIDAVDPEVAAAIRDEFERQQYTLELIPSENIASPAVLQALGSLLNNKYAEGYPGKRYYGGCENVDRIETLAIERARTLFGAEHANVQSHCGTTANYTVYSAVIYLGDTVMGMELYTACTISLGCSSH